jgi:hypothetical protein
MTAFWELDDGGSTYPWNVGLLLRDYTTLYPRRQSPPNQSEFCCVPMVRRNILPSASRLQFYFNAHNIETMFFCSNNEHGFL